MSSRSSKPNKPTAPVGAPVPWYQKPAVVRTWKILGFLCKCLFTVLLVFVITGCLVACALMVYVSTAVDVSSDIPELTTSSTASTSIIMTYNENSKSWEEFMRLEGANHIRVSLEDIPIHLQRAVIAIEDERFLQHNGVDWKRTASAFANLVFKFSSTEYGASTLTQQLIKQLTGDDDHTVMRKVTEILKAIELERIYTKDEIIEAYLNVLPLTGDIKGVGVGANYYFGVDVQDLTIAQSAVIA
ncbi:MAG: transglycosylase domain-containing protein, partial [Clostridia bacterium]|nr:transglycosylase domain-containing protein [Clostridia bacterium]